jgi:hypothetical protein
MIGSYTVKTNEGVQGHRRTNGLLIALQFGHLQPSGTVADFPSQNAEGESVKGHGLDSANPMVAWCVIVSLFRIAHYLHRHLYRPLDYKWPTWQSP